MKSRGRTVALMVSISVGLLSFTGAGCMGQIKQKPAAKSRQKATRPAPRKIRYAGTTADYWSTVYPMIIEMSRHMKEVQRLSDAHESVASEQKGEWEASLREVASQMKTTASDVLALDVVPRTMARAHNTLITMAEDMNAISGGLLDYLAKREEAVLDRLAAKIDHFVRAGTTFQSQLREAGFRRPGEAP